MFFEEQLIYFPTRAPDGFREVAVLRTADPDAPAIEDRSFAASDGVRLHGWYCTGREGASRPVLLFFHGNAGNLAVRSPKLFVHSPAVCGARGVRAVVCRQPRIEWRRWPTDLFSRG